jgi:anti-sigma regulatory factor (Ser/Thr protein kinase)
MDVVRRLELDQHAASVGVARQFVRDCLRDWRAEGPDDVPSLVVSELVTNALQHASGPVTVFVARRIDRIVLSVEDGSTAMAEVELPGPLEESGRGMMLVESLTHAWGEQPVEGGKRVWAEVSQR